MSYSINEIEVKKLNFDSINVGDFAEFTHKITQNDINLFASLTGDFNPLHTNIEYAKNTLFQKPVAHGMLSASFISTIIGTRLPGEGSLWSSQTLDFLRPAFIGDTLFVRSKVIQKSAATRVLVLDTKVTNQHHQILISGKSLVKMLNSDNNGFRKEDSNEVFIKNRIKEEKSHIENIPQKNSDRIVLVTGGSGGIGEAIVRKLAKKGYKIVINHRNNSDAVVDLIKTIGSKGSVVLEGRADISNIEELEDLNIKIQNNIGFITDIVHCAAPVPIPTAFELLSWEDFQLQIDVQLKGAFNCAKVFLPSMIKMNKGTFTFISSIFADGVPPNLQTHYVSTKAALSAFGRSIAVEYGYKGIRSNIVAPGMTQTEMIAGIPDKTKLLTKINTPLRKIANPEDIANVVEFLVSDASNHVTGETIRVCGGIAM